VQIMWKMWNREGAGESKGVVFAIMCSSFSDAGRWRSEAGQAHRGCSRRLQGRGDRPGVVRAQPPEIDGDEGRSRQEEIARRNATWLTCNQRETTCGCGVIGASIAYFLSCRGVQSIVIELTGLACAASGRAQLSPPAAIVHYSGGTRALSQDTQGKLAFVEKETR
jgi:hypothetical protein